MRWALTACAAVWRTNAENRDGVRSSVWAWIT